MLGIGSGDAFKGAFQAAAFVDQLLLFFFELVCCTTQLKISFLGLSLHVLGPLLLLLEELRQELLLIFELLPEHVSVGVGGWRCRAQRSRN